jgi:sulfoxide reductase heme-binding subunit YedZ
MLFLSGALLIGPLRRAAGQSSPANIYQRRDLGIWAGLQGLLHSYAGTVVSMNQSYMDAFVNADAPPLNAAVRYELFFWSGTGAFVVSLLFIFLLLISSDRALRWLGVDRWKKFQRSAYVALWLTVLHGLAFQLLEGRYLPFAVFAVISLVVFWLQFRGRRRSA